MNASSSPLRTRVALAAAIACAAACSSENPTQVVVDDDYPPVPDGGDPSSEVTVYKVWWVTTLMPDAVAPGGEGQVQRTVPGAGVAYAVLAPGWDPRSGSAPTRFLAAKSTASLAASQGHTLHIHVSDSTFDGNCAAGEPLSQDDADFVTQRIFPAEFAGQRYDAATCSVSAGGDGGVDGATDAALDAGGVDGATDAALDAGGDDGPTDAATGGADAAATDTGDASAD
jgi:hypothetical protein